MQPWIGLTRRVDPPCPAINMFERRSIPAYGDSYDKCFGLSDTFCVLQMEATKHLKRNLYSKFGTEECILFMNPVFNSHKKQTSSPKMQLARAFHSPCFRDVLLQVLYDRPCTAASFVGFSKEREGKQSQEQCAGPRCCSSVWYGLHLLFGDTWKGTTSIGQLWPSRQTRSRPSNRNGSQAAHPFSSVLAISPHLF